MNEKIKEIKEYGRTEFIRTNHFCLSCDFIGTGVCIVIGTLKPFFYLRLLNLEVRFF